MPIQVTQQNEPHTQDVTIAISTSLSPVFRIPFGHQLAAILMPAAWTAAGITFNAGYTTATHLLYDTAGNELAFTVDAAQYIVIPPDTLNGVHRCKIRSGTQPVPVNQLAARTLTIITRPIA